MEGKKPFRSLFSAIGLLSLGQEGEEEASSLGSFSPLSPGHLPSLRLPTELVKNIAGPIGGGLLCHGTLTSSVGLWASAGYWLGRTGGFQSELYRYAMT